MSVTGPGTKPSSSGSTRDDASALIFPAAPRAISDLRGPFPLCLASNPPRPLAFAVLLAHAALTLGRIGLPPDSPPCLVAAAAAAAARAFAAGDTAARDGVFGDVEFGDLSSNKPSTGSSSTGSPLLAIMFATRTLPLFSRRGGSMLLSRTFREGSGVPRQQSPIIARVSALTTTWAKPIRFLSTMIVLF